jgi:transposase-like protein
MPKKELIGKLNWWNTHKTHESMNGGRAMAHMYCPQCQGITEIKTVGASIQPKSEKSLHFKRRRKCQTCKREFTTIEVEESLIKIYEEFVKVLTKIDTDIKELTAKLSL